MINRPGNRAAEPEAPDGPAVFRPDLIIGRHPVHGVLADDHADDITVLCRGRAGFVYDEALAGHRLPAGASPGAEQDCVQPAMTSLSGHLSVAYLPDGPAAEATGFSHQQFLPD